MATLPEISTLYSFSAIEIAQSSINSLQKTRRLANKEITKERVDELLAFLPLFEEEGVQFVDGWIQNAYPRYTSDVNSFFNQVAQPWWRDTNYLRSEASKKIRDFDFIRSADIDAIKTMLTTALRSERFGDGSWLWLLENGVIQAILRRLEILQKLSTFPAN